MKSTCFSLKNSFLFFFKLERMTNMLIEIIINCWNYGCFLFFSVFQMFIDKTRIISTLNSVHLKKKKRKWYKRNRISEHGQELTKEKVKAWLVQMGWTQVLKHEWKIMAIQGMDRNSVCLQHGIHIWTSGRNEAEEVYRTQIKNSMYFKLRSLKIEVKENFEWGNGRLGLTLPEVLRMNWKGRIKEES